MTVSLPLLIQSPEVTEHQFATRTLLPIRQDSLWKIETGVVRTLTWIEDGTAITLGLWGEGDVVGKILSKVNPYCIECLTEVTATLLPIDRCYNITEELVAHIREAEALAVIRSYKTLEDCLFKLLIWLAKRFGHPSEQGQAIDLYLTHRDLAELLSVSRVSVTRALNKLEQQGLIHRLSRRLIVLPEQESWYYEI